MWLGLSKLYVSSRVRADTVALTQNSIETCLSPSIEVILAQFRSFCLELPQCMHPYFSRILVRQHLFSERLVHWGQDFSDRFTSICHEKLCLSSLLVKPTTAVKTSLTSISTASECSSGFHSTISWPACCSLSTAYFSARRTGGVGLEYRNQL